MLALQTIRPSDRAPAPDGLPELIDSIGAAAFQARTIDYLRAQSGGEHCVMWVLQRERMLPLGAASWNGADQAQRRLGQYATQGYWKKDPALAVARQSGTRGNLVIRMDPRYAADTRFREILYGEDRICERVVMCKTQPEAIYGLSVVRSEAAGPFTPPQIDNLSRCSDTLLSVLAKHSQISAGRQAFNPVAPTALPEIERTLQGASPGLPRREAQVCARIICGARMSSIASELGISAETVDTYRRRAYRRYGLGSRHELLLRYMGYC